MMVTNVRKRLSVGKVATHEEIRFGGAKRGICLKCQMIAALETREGLQNT